MKIKRIGAWLLARAQERSTWQGLAVAVAVLLGRDVAPEYAAGIAEIGVFVAGALMAATEGDDAGGADQ